MLSSHEIFYLYVFSKWCSGTSEAILGLIILETCQGYCTGNYFLVQSIQNCKETGISPTMPVYHKILYHHMTFILDKQNEAKLKLKNSAMQTSTLVT